MKDIAEVRLPHRSVGGVKVALVTEEELTEAMVEDAERRRQGALPSPMTVLSCNGQSLSLYANDKSYAKAMDNADIVHADGQFIVWMSRMFGDRPVPERTATTDFIHAAAAAAARHGLSFYLLGAAEDINRRCADNLKALYPGLRIAGRRNGYFDPSEEEDVIAAINASGADVVWVGLGKPKEQLFIERIKSRLNCAWIVSCGGCFNFAAGDYVRAPLWMQKSGLEWLHRALTGPKYLIGRYAYTIPHAISLVIRNDLFGSGKRASG